MFCCKLNTALMIENDGEVSKKYCNICLIGFFFLLSAGAKEATCTLLTAIDVLSLIPWMNTRHKLYQN